MTQLDLENFMLDQVYKVMEHPSLDTLYLRFRDKVIRGERPSVLELQVEMEKAKRRKEGQDV